jgi:hypothetical protein
MSKSKKSASSPVTYDSISPLTEAVIDAVVRHTSLDQVAVENLRRALASGQA